MVNVRLGVVDHAAHTLWVGLHVQSVPAWFRENHTEVPDGAQKTSIPDRWTALLALGRESPISNTIEVSTQHVHYQDSGQEQQLHKGLATGLGGILGCIVIHVQRTHPSNSEGPTLECCP